MEKESDAHLLFAWEGFLLGEALALPDLALGDFALAFLDWPAFLRFLEGAFLAAVPHEPCPRSLRAVGRMFSVLTVASQRASTSASSLGTGYFLSMTIGSKPSSRMKLTHARSYFQSGSELKWPFPSFTKY